MKRRLFKLGLLLLAWGAGGAIVNVAVAWGIAISPPGERRGFERQPLHSRPQTFVWISPCEVSITQSSGMMNCWWAGEPPRSVNEETYCRLIPRGSAFSGHDPVRDFDTREVMVDISERIMGWPSLSMVYMTTLRLESADKFTVETTALKMPAEWWANLGWTKSEGNMPVWPIWPGFAINTIFYAAILWLLFFAPVALRRTIRRRRGLCPACAYPVGEGPVCTECGKPVTPRVVEPS